MALRRCKDCKKQISTDAARCPNCGAGRPLGSGCLLSIVLLIIFLICIFHDEIQPPSPDNKTNIARQAVKPEEKKLNYSLPVYTVRGAIICPISLLLDKREDHSPQAVMDMYATIWDRDLKVKEMGCETWQAGIRVWASKANSLVYLKPSPDAIVPTMFTLEFNLSNQISGE